MKNNYWKDFIGAFSDGAILFPLLAALALQGGFSSAMLLATSGLAYLAAAWIFRIPMPVQPLKAIAIAAVAIGATSTEIRVSAALLGVLCLLLTVSQVDEWSRKIPQSLIHALQLGLGILLVTQGLQYASTSHQYILVGAVTGLMLVAPLYTEFPLLGFVATAGLVWAVIAGFSGGASPLSPPNIPQSTLRLSIVASLALPQVALTFFNSALATKDVAERYYGEAARRVTVSKLLRSIGFGNLLTAAVGGLPFCHGSGGLTAHYRGGARHWISNVIIGTVLLAFAAIQLIGGSMGFKYPLFLLASLLFATGVFHVRLAKPTWDSQYGKLKLVACGVAAVATKNMLWVLGVALVLEFAIRFFAPENTPIAEPQLVEEKL